MHTEAMEWVRTHATREPVRVLDIGGRNINGSPRPLFPQATYTTLDIRPADGIDILADAATYRSDLRFDVIVCCEVFEHTKVWPEICSTAYEHLVDGGLFIVTCAGPNRAVHSGVDGGADLHPGEWYRNLEVAELSDVLKDCGFRDVLVEQLVRDVRAVATK